MRFNRTFLTFTIFSIALISCQNDEPIKEGTTDLTYVPNDRINVIKPPFLDRNIEQEIFMIDAQQDEEITTESGSKITLYKNTIVDGDGKIVKGKVKIEYRDFHDPVEVFLSGIPMEYDSAGTKYVFETAGMFELKAYKDEQLLNLKEAKKIDVELMSTSNEASFNFYSLDEATGVWFLEEEPMQITTTSKSNTLEELEKRALFKPIAQNSKNYSFEINVDKSEYPELETYEGTIFEVKEKNSFSPIYYNVQWDKVKLDKENRNHYILKLFKEDTSIVVDVKPVIKSEKYNQAIANYKQIKKEVDKVEPNDFDVYGSLPITFNSSASSQYEIKRQFEVSGFGIFNVDQPKINPRGEIDNVFVKVNDQIRKVKNASFYLVNLEQNSLISLYQNPKYFKGRENVLWAIIESKQMLIASPSQIKTMSEKALYLQSYSIEEGLEILENLIALK